MQDKVEKHIINKLKEKEYAFDPTAWDDFKSFQKEHNTIESKLLEKEYSFNKESWVDFKEYQKADEQNSRSKRRLLLLIFSFLFVGGIIGWVLNDLISTKVTDQASGLAKQEIQVQQELEALAPAAKQEILLNDISEGNKNQTKNTEKKRNIKRSSDKINQLENPISNDGINENSKSNLTVNQFEESKNNFAIDKETKTVKKNADSVQHAILPNNPIAQKHFNKQSEVPSVIESANTKVSVPVKAKKRTPLVLNDISKLEFNSLVWKEEKPELSTNILKVLSTAKSSKIQALVGLGGSYNNAEASAYGQIMLEKKISNAFSIAGGLGFGIRKFADHKVLSDSIATYGFGVEYENVSMNLERLYELHIPIRLNYKINKRWNLFAEYRHLISTSYKITPTIGVLDSSSAGGAVNVQDDQENRFNRDYSYTYTPRDAQQFSLGLGYDLGRGLRLNALYEYMPKRNRKGSYGLQIEKKF